MKWRFHMQVWGPGAVTCAPKQPAEEEGTPFKIFFNFFFFSFFLLSALLHYPCSQKRDPFFSLLGAVSNRLKQASIRKGASNCLKEQGQNSSPLSPFPAHLHGFLRYVSG